MWGMCLIYAGMCLGTGRLTLNSNHLLSTVASPHSAADDGVEAELYGGQLIAHDKIDNTWS